MKSLPRLRAALQRWSLWRKANVRKLLKEMPLAYLLIVTAPSAAIVMLVQPSLVKATNVFIEQLLPSAPWYVSLTASVLLFAWWTIVGTSALLAATHGRALGDRLFNSPQVNV